MSVKPALFVLVFLLGLLPAVAAPSLLGPTGLLNVPTADALSAEELAFAVYGTEGGSHAAYIFNYGVRQNLEVGFTRFTDRETVVNAKYNFQPEIGRRMGVAVGVADLTDEVNTALYVVASKKLPVNAPGLTNLRLHLGLASGGNANSDIPLHGFFTGLSIDISNRVILIGEQDGSHFNFGGNVVIGNGLQVNIGAVGENQVLRYGVSYNTRY